MASEGRDGDEANVQAEPSAAAPASPAADEPAPVSAPRRSDPISEPISDDGAFDEGDGFVVADEAEAEGPPAPTIFVTDPTVEAARVEWALRARGYNVIDVPLAMLAGRVTVQRPHLVLLDVDAPGALEIAARVRQLPGASGVHLIYAGVAGKTFESARDAFTHEGSGFFARPVDVEALVTKIDSLLGIEPAPIETSAGAASARPMRRSSRPPPPPPSLRAPPSPLPPRPSNDQAAAAFRAPSEPPSSEPPRPMSARKPPGWTARASEARLSPDLERLLRDAEQRVGGPTSQRAPESVPASDDEILSPEDEVEAVLPAEILASLDEPLDVELDDEEGGSSETGGGTPHATTGRAADVRTSSGREQTHGGSAAEIERAVLERAERPVEPTPAHEAFEPSAATTSAGRRVGTSAGTAVPATARAAPGSDRSARSEESPGTRPAVPASASGTGVDAPAPVRRDVTTPKPPRRAAPEAIGDSPEAGRASLIEERAQSQVDYPRHLPAPEPEHAPPLAPQTSRPPAHRNVAAPEPQPVAPAIAAKPLPLPVELPQPRAITSPDEALRSLAAAVAGRVTGVLRYDEANGIRRIVLQDGDVVTAASSVEGESLLGYLAGRGDLPLDVVRKLEGRVPPFGRLAGAALVAHGHLHQDQLWDVLQAHAAWLLTRAVAIARGRVAYEAEPPQRLRGEPPVFGGTPGPALVVEIVRRAVQPADAIARLGGPDVRFTTGGHAKLVDECGLDDDDDETLRRANGAALRELIETRGEDAPPLLYALAALGVLETLAGIRPGARAPDVPSAPEVDLADPLRDAELDDSALRARIAARRALVDDGDYFAILGVTRDATGYEIKRAYIDLRRALDPARVMRPSLLDLADDLKLVLSVLDEAYDVLKDATRRERYRRAITHDPPAR